MSEPAAVPLARPLRWRVNSLELAGLSWGEPGDKPLLALHGWLDNAASFTRLAPLLSGYHVVAPDLTGHGQSARRSADASYQIWDDLPELLGILDELGWKKFDLLGHSRGAIIAALLASSFPERVNHLVLLDAVAPVAVAPEKFPGQLRKALLEKQSLLARSNRVFASVDEAVTSRTKNGLSKTAARLLVERSLRPAQAGLTWTTDPRLHGASAVKLTDAQIRAVLQGLQMPSLLVVARDNAMQQPEWAEFAQTLIEDLAVYAIDGGHHFHMESSAPELAHHIDDFLSEKGKREFT